MMQIYAEILQVINVNGKPLAVYGSKQFPLFLAVDVSKAIDYSNGNTTNMLRYIDPGDKTIMNVRNSKTSARGNSTPKWFLTEDGMYEVLMQSRKPVARRFKRAVKDILHDLRMQDDNGLDSLAQWMNESDPLVDEWEDVCRFRTDAGLPELTFVEFLHQKGYSDDMIV